MPPTVSDVFVYALDMKLAGKIAHFTATDLLVKDAMDAMSKHTSLFPHAVCEDWTFLDGALYFKEHLYVLEPAHQDLLCSLHCSLVRGHGRYFHTIPLIQHDYWGASGMQSSTALLC